MNVREKFLKAVTAGVFLSSQACLAAEEAPVTPAATSDSACTQQNTPLTKHSKTVAEFSSRFSAGRPGAGPILYLDKDDIERRAGRLSGEGALAGTVPHYRLLWALNDYIHEKSHMHVSSAEAAQLLRFLMEGSPTTFWKAGETDGVNIIIPAMPDNPHHIMDATAFSLRGKAAAKQAIYSAWRNAGMDAETHMRLTNFHETAHASDKAFNPRATQKTVQDWNSVLLRHRAEMFGDVVALLQMAREGKTKAPAAYQYAARILENQYGYQEASLQIVSRGLRDDTAGNAAAAFYWTVPGIEAAKAYIDQTGPAGLKKMGDEDVLRVAERIVNENALNLQQAQGVILASAFHREDGKQAVAVVKRLLDLLPEKERSVTAQQVEKVWAATETLLDSLKEKAAPPVDPATVLPPDHRIVWGDATLELAEQVHSSGLTCAAFEKAISATKDRLRNKISAAASGEEAQADVLALQNAGQVGLFLGAILKNAKDLTPVYEQRTTAKAVLSPRP